MKTNLSQSEILAKAPAITSNSTLQDNLRSLRLSYLLENAVPAAEQAAGNGSGHLQFLQELSAGEVALRHDKSVQRRIHDARFPVIKTMAGWDWNWPAKVNRMQVEHLLELEFLTSHSNVFFIGPTGVGKSHLATALGHVACLHGHSVLFAAAIDVVNRLSAAESNRQLAREIKRYQGPRILLIDELGYLPLDKRGAELLFQVINELKELIENMDGWTLAVGKAEFEAVQKLMKELADEVDSLSFGLKANVKNVTAQITTQLNA